MALPMVDTGQSLADGCVFVSCQRIDQTRWIQSVGSDHTKDGPTAIIQMAICQIHKRCLVLRVKTRNQRAKEPSLPFIEDRLGTQVKSKLLDAMLQFWSAQIRRGDSEGSLREDQLPQGEITRGK